MLTCSTVPMPWRSSRSRAPWSRGLWFQPNATTSARPRASASSTRSQASAGAIVNGFSTSTLAPASIAARACS